MGRDVFISHSSNDRAAAAAVLAALEGAGFSCWIAPRDIVPGQEYGEAIVEAIRSSRIFLLILSASSVDSPQVGRETERAVNAGLSVIPFRIEEVVPSRSLEYFISTAHWLDAFPPPLEPHLDYLVTVVRHRLGDLEGPPDRAAAAAAAPQPSRPRPARRWLPLAAAGTAAFAALAAAAFFLMRPGEVRDCTGVPDTAQTGFVQRATPMRSDKPLWLREGPSPQARQITRIGPDEVFRVVPSEGAAWLPARLCDGTTGFVARRFVTLVPVAPVPAGATR